jgi:hypothetical protein
MCLQLQHVTKYMGDDRTYTLPVLVGNVAILQSEFNLLLILSRHFVVAIDHVCVAPTTLDQILNLLRRDASPVAVSRVSPCCRKGIIPVPVLPALMILDSDLDGIAEFAFHDLDSSILALLVLTSCAVVGRSLWNMVSILKCGARNVRKTCQLLTNTRYDHCEGANGYAFEWMARKTRADELS